MYLFHFDILRQHSDGVKKVDQAIKDVEYYRQVQTIHIIQYISYMKVSVPYGKTHLWCSHLYHQKPHFLWLSWRECTKCASHSSAANRHSPTPLPPFNWRVHRVGAKVCELHLWVPWLGNASKFICWNGLSEDGLSILKSFFLFLKEKYFWLNNFLWHWRCEALALWSGPVLYPSVPA